MDNSLVLTIIGIGSIVGVTFYLIHSFTIYRMSVNQNLPHSWFSFFPVLCSFQQGLVVQPAIKDTSFPWKLSAIVFLDYIATIFTLLFSEQSLSLVIGTIATAAFIYQIKCLFYILETYMGKEAANEQFQQPATFYLTLPFVLFAMRNDPPVFRTANNQDNKAETFY